MASKYTLPKWREKAPETGMAIDAYISPTTKLQKDKWAFSSDQRYDDGCHNDSYVEDNRIDNTGGGGDGPMPRDLPRSGRYGK